VSALARVLSAVEFWVAVIAAAASITAAVISRSGGPKSGAQSTAAASPTGSPQASPSPPSCLALLERTRAWADAYPRDAAVYAAAGDADLQGFPSLWSRAERGSCGADPERLLERTRRGRQRP
jgi:hypothetical protein